MREVKYRVPHFNYNGTFNNFSYWGRLEPGEFSSPAYLNTTKAGEDEQYTGLKDKNGKKIFEGDIVAYDDDFKHSGVIQFSCGIFGINWDYSKNTDSEWKQGRMYGSWGDEHNLRKISDGFNREIIIIGNIHENPELLA